MQKYLECILLNIARYALFVCGSDCRPTRTILQAAQVGRIVFWETIFWKMTRKMLVLSNITVSLLLTPRPYVQVIQRGQKVFKVGYY